MVLSRQETNNLQGWVSLKSIKLSRWWKVKALFSTALRKNYYYFISISMTKCFLFQKYCKELKCVVDKESSKNSMSPPFPPQLEFVYISNSAFSGWKEGEECAERDIQIALKQGWTYNFLMTSIVKCILFEKSSKIL